VDDPDYAIWRDDAEVLAEIGRCLFVQDLRVSVRLPASLAAHALAAWERDDPENEISGDENHSERAVRHQAGNLALIGPDIKNRTGTSDGDHVTVELDAWQIGAALDAADERRLLKDVRPPNPAS
jgi:hypothetical protein